MMYVRGHEAANVQKWVDAVRDLRYKDYQLVAPVDVVVDGRDPEAGGPRAASITRFGTLEEVDTVKELAARMDSTGLTKWWRIAMGFIQE